ncbi:TIGR02680 family protein [Streptomyces mirabilis]|uniref:TIGR02680 family protein n=1 Tax=Streptomyces mirabilis TaxID=68239 RepID=UPI0021C1D8EE|nr:TIGR02680 family protein [Streptomyces mirabilis]MCT9110989.1 TIGR02680 family protein [Streptomyces mirabilis]
MTVTELPGAQVTDDAAKARWSPSRAGVLNVWRYYDEVFTFHRGRLLLRGPNGTGKSKALEVLLPFLLDASLKPNRLSTFGGNERTMHWNMMGEGATGITRVGYVWLEFRTWQAGAEEWFTIGARLQATSRTTSVGADFFTVRDRIRGTGRAGAGVSLVGETGQPLTRAALAEALAGQGEVYDSATDYKAAVRQTLFPGLSAQRYEALVTALLQLRTPKLSERLDPSLLSTLLSRALPPLDRGEIAELADGFERLDRQREALALMDERVRVADTLASRQRAYAQRVLRARAADLISATTEMDNRTRAARETEEAHTVALEEQTSAQERQHEAEALGKELAARIETLTESDEYREGKKLDELRQRVVEARSAAEGRRATADAARADAEEDAARAAAAEEQAAVRHSRAENAGEETWQAARGAQLTSVCAEIATALQCDDEGRARQLVSAAVRSRLGQIADVRAALGNHHGAVRGRTTAEAALEEARTTLATAIGRRDDLAAACAAAVDTQAGRLRDWARNCEELRFDTESVEELVGQAAQEAEVLALVDALARPVERELTTAETMLGQRRLSLVAERSEAAAEADRLERAEEIPPSPPYTRTSDRAMLPGAPLWKLIAFHDTVPADEQAAIEAALEASGLLDAWLGPHGGLIATGHDIFAEPGWSSARPVGRSLADVLRPEPDSPVPAERIAHLLSAVSYGETLPAEGAAAVGADGTWRLAAATGSWSKPESAHIGASARQRARHRRIAQLGFLIAELEEAIRACDTERATLADRRGTLELERLSRPDHAPVVTAQRALDRADADVAARDDAVRSATTVLSKRESDVAQALRALEALASEHGLPTEEATLDRLVESTEAFREAAGQWLLASVRLAAGLSTAAEARERADRAQRTAGDREGEARDAETGLRTLTGTLEEAQATTGASYQEVLDRIAELRAERKRADRSVSELHGELRELASRIGSLDSRRATAAGLRDAATGSRDLAAERLRRCTQFGFTSDAGAEDAAVPLDAKVTATLEAARAIAARWPSVPHSPKNIADALGRLAETVHTTRQALSERADLSLEPSPDTDDDLQVLTAAMDGALIGASKLLTALTDERDHSRDDITASERGLFDRILTGDTRRHLASRIRQANELVDAMNTRLEKVRTASRVAVCLVWQIDPALPPGTRAARDLLLKDPVRLTDSDHEALHQFFRTRIEEAMAGRLAGSWEEQLAQVLDYTAWHQFVVKLDRANGQGWQLLTKKLHGALSGGEKAIALHLPLFAAVASHYHTVPEAPRLILLDEVFVGVDATNRGQVFALLSSLDLDLLLTSDHEWCTYRELDGIAIHQLITDGDDDAVTTARFVWDGAGLLPDEASV